MSNGLNLVFMKCPNCGASLELIPGNTHGACDYCGASFVVAPPSQEAPAVDPPKGPWPPEAAPATTQAPSARAGDIVRKCTKLLVKRFRKAYGVDLTQDHIALQRLRAAI